MVSCQLKVNLACILLTFWSYTDFIESKRIHVNLLEYDQSYSETKCREGLIDGKDVAVFRTVADLRGASIHWGRYIMYEIQTTDGRNYIFEASLIDCNNISTSEVCYCELNDSSIFYVTCRFRAQIALSNANIRAKISSINGGHKNSANRTFPDIFDPDLIVILGNEQTVQKDLCNITLYTPSYGIKLYCENSPSLCGFSVWSNGQRIAKEDGALVSSIRFKRLTIEYSVCDKTRHIQCDVNYVASKQSTMKFNQDVDTMIGFINKAIEINALSPTNRKAMGCRHHCLRIAPPRQKNNIGMVDRNHQILSEKKDIENLEISRCLNASSEEIINQDPTIDGSVYSIDCSSQLCDLSYIGESKEKMNKVKKRWEGKIRRNKDQSLVTEHFNSNKDCKPIYTLLGCNSLKKSRIQMKLKIIEELKTRLSGLNCNKPTLEGIRQSTPTRPVNQPKITDYLKPTN
ncbi:hypothetical protein BgiBS90_019165 [Biomphalaria glabrata]|nr:hypothetical protein BgiBS90_019165 [Biomphalaria glabrata]